MQIWYRGRVVGTFQPGTLFRDGIREKRFPAGMTPPPSAPWISLETVCDIQT